MPLKSIIQPLETDRYFHIYNKGINGQKTFQNAQYYEFFLQKYKYYLNRDVDTLAFCLLPNHFHFLIKTRPSKKANYNLTISNQFRKLCICYAHFYNRQANRIGNLCFRHFRRVIIEDDDYLRYLFFYIHFNPQKHRIISDFRLFQYSSYNLMYEKRQFFIAKDKVLGLFDGCIENFEEFHMEHFRDKSLAAYEINE